MRWHTSSSTSKPREIQRIYVTIIEFLRGRGVAVLNTMNFDAPGDEFTRVASARLIDGRLKVRLTNGPVMCGAFVLVEATVIAARVTCDRRCIQLLGSANVTVSGLSIRVLRW